MSTYMVQFLYRTFVYGIALLTALPFHEFAHGWVANKLGDPTAKWQGRLTLNPLKHLDPMGALLMLFCGIGWAKPVPINPRNFKHPKEGMAISSLAGPLSNILLAFASMILYKLSVIAGFYATGFLGTTVASLQYIFSTMVGVNVSLAVFNLIPVPPLDGSRVLNLFLPERLYFQIMQYERMIMIFMMFIVFSGVLDRPLSAARTVVWNLLDFMTGFIDLILRAVL